MRYVSSFPSFSSPHLGKEKSIFPPQNMHSGNNIPIPAPRAICRYCTVFLTELLLQPSESYPGAALRYKTVKASHRLKRERERRKVIKPRARDEYLYREKWSLARPGRSVKKYKEEKLARKYGNRGIFPQSRGEPVLTPAWNERRTDGQKRALFKTFNSLEKERERERKIYMKTGNTPRNRNV